MPSRRAWASACQQASSYHVPAASSARSRSGPRWSAKIARASSRSASCSGVNAKSTGRSDGAARLARHAEPGHRDDVALHLVGAAAEGEDGRVPAVEMLEPAAQHRVGAAAAHAGGGAEDLEQQAVGLDVELAAEHLDDRGVGVVERAAGDAPRLL